jgi:hypothetical protein
MEKIIRSPYSKFFGIVLAATAFAWGTAAQAHCDTLDGPVVEQGRKALDSGNVNLVLGWVQKQDEAEVRKSFERAAAVRKQGGTARELADHAFFETLVRVHRAGEGAPYTGLKPAGQIEPAVAAADKSIASGQLKPVARMVMERAEQGLHQKFDAVQATRKYNPNDVEAARAYVKAYVDYVHYVERLHESAGTTPHAAAKPADAPPKTEHKH